MEVQRSAPEGKPHAQPDARSPRSMAATRVPGAIGMALVTVATLSGLYGALALALHPG